MSHLTPPVARARAELAQISAWGALSLNILNIYLAMVLWFVSALQQVRFACPHITRGRAYFTSARDMIRLISVCACLLCLFMLFMVSASVV